MLRSANDGDMDEPNSTTACQASQANATYAHAPSDVSIQDDAPTGYWSRIITLAGLMVLGITPWAHAQLAPPNEPAFCPPLTSLATPTLFNVLTDTTPIRFPFQ